MKKKCIVFILMLLFLTSFQSLSFSGTYEFANTEVPFYLTHINLWDGSESENILFSIVSTGDQDWFDETSGDVRLPIIGDVIESVRLRGPEGLDITTSETFIPWTPFYSIEGNYKTVTCRETSDHSILEGFPTVHVFSILPTEMFWRHVVQA